MGIESVRIDGSTVQVNLCMQVRTTARSTGVPYRSDYVVIEVMVKLFLSFSSLLHVLPFFFSFQKARKAQFSLTRIASPAAGPPA